MTPSNDILLQDTRLNDILELALGSVADRAAIPPYLAKQIEQRDPTEIYCHIEWPNEDNGYTKPHVWRLEDWRTSNKRFTQRKEIKGQERSIEVRAFELRKEFIRQLGVATGMSAEMCEPLAKAIIFKRDTVVAKMYGIDITELLESDTALIEYKLAKGIRL